MWLNISAGILIITTICVIINWSFGSDAAKPLTSIAPTIFMMLYKLYMIWIVYSYMRVLRFNNNIDNEIGNGDGDNLNQY